MAVEKRSRKAVRAICATVAAVGAVLVVRWVVQTAALHSGKAEREVSVADGRFEDPPATCILSEIIPDELETNIAGLAVKKRSERMGMAYSLAVDVAVERAKAAGWERVDDEDVLTVKALSGSESVYRTPSGAVVHRRITPLAGGDAMCTDFEIPVELIPVATETITPDELARRGGEHVKSLMPGKIGGVIVGSPLFTELVKRGRGGAFIVHSVVSLTPSAVDRQIDRMARESGWAKAAGVERTWLLDNLVFTYASSMRQDGMVCDIDYRFSDDESGLYTKGKKDEN